MANAPCYYNDTEENGEWGENEFPRFFKKTLKSSENILKGQLTGFLGYFTLFLKVSK